VVARAGELEAAYNPNDCVEIRLGPPQRGPPEDANCRERPPR